MIFITGKIKANVCKYISLGRFLRILVFVFILKAPYLVVCCIVCGCLLVAKFLVFIEEDRQHGSESVAFRSVKFTVDSHANLYLKVRLFGYFFTLIIRMWNAVSGGREEINLVWKILALYFFVFFILSSLLIKIDKAVVRAKNNSVLSIPKVNLTFGPAGFSEARSAHLPSIREVLN